MTRLVLDMQILYLLQDDQQLYAKLSSEFELAELIPEVSS